MLTLQHTMVAICTTCAVCKDCVSWAYHWAAIISLYAYVFNPLLFVLETDCVYCAVRLESLAKTGYISLLKTVSRLRRVAGISRRTKSSIPGQTVSDSWRTGARPFPKYFCSLRSVSLHHCHILAFIHALLLPGEQNGRILGNLQKNTTLLRNSGNTAYKITPTFSSLR